MKDFQRDAALFARDALFNEDPQHHSAVLIRLSSIARCVWSRNLKLYFTLARHSELAREHLVLENHVPRLAQPEASEEAVRVTKNDHFLGPELSLSKSLGSSLGRNHK